MAHNETERPSTSPAAGLGQAAKSPWRPTVSVVLPIRNEAGHIESCLERLLEQDYPSDLVEVLVVDGLSNDGTRDAVARVQARYQDAAVRLLDNPKRTVAPGLNVGVCAARGEVIVRMDGHTVPSNGYVSACVAALARSGAANAGGVIIAQGMTPFGQAVALATQHPLGAGDAEYRVGGAAGDVDTVPFGAFRRGVFERVGLFDESLLRNQDYEFNVRIRSAGERVYFDPAIRSVYTPRGSVRHLASQYLQYGWWKVETLRRHPRSLRWRQVVPPACVGGLAAAALLAYWWTPAALALAAGATAYLAVLGSVSWRIATPPTGAASVLAAFAIVHVTWSIGFILNVVSRGRYPFRAEAPLIPRFVAASPRAPREVPT